MKKIFSLALIVALVFSLTATPVSAITYDNVTAETFVTYRTGENGVSSYYKNGEFYEKLTSVPKTGDGRTDALAVALSQVGYNEGDSEEGFSGTDLSGNSDYTEYNYNAGDNGSGYGGDYPWSATFISFVLYQSGATDHGTWDDMCRENMYEEDYVWREIDPAIWADQLRYFGMYEYSAYHGGSYIPQPGDLIFYSWSDLAYDEDRMGMVVYCDGSTIWAVDGDVCPPDGLTYVHGGVHIKKYSINHTQISGYGILPYEEKKTEPIDYSGNNPTPGIYIATGGAKTLFPELESLTGSDYIPQYAMFEVFSIEKDSLGNDMMYIKYESGDEVKYGYIGDGSLTNKYISVVQLYAEPSALEYDSDVYELTEDNTIEGVVAGTTVQDFLSNINVGDDMTAIVRKGDDSTSQTEPVATGMSLIIYDENGDVADLTIVVKGDANGDGGVTAADYILLKRHVQGTYTLQNAFFKAGAVSTKGSIGTNDYILAKRHVQGTYTIK